MDDKLMLAVFVGVEGAHAFSAFMPSYFTVRKFASSAEDLQSLRSGYPPALSFNLILGAVVSSLTKSAYPFIVSVAVSIFMVFLYEQAIGGNRAELQNSRR